MNTADSIKAILKIDEEIKKFEENEYSDFLKRFFYENKLNSGYLTFPRKNQTVKYSIPKVYNLYVNILLALVFRNKTNNKGRLTLDNGQKIRLSKIKNAKIDDIKELVVEENIIKVPSSWLKTINAFKGDLVVYNKIRTDFIQHLITEESIDIDKAFKDIKFFIENIDRFNEEIEKISQLTKMKDAIKRQLLQDNEVENMVEWVNNTYLPFEKNINSLSETLKQGQFHNVVVKKLLEKENFDRVIQLIREDVSKSVYFDDNDISFNIISEDKIEYSISTKYDYEHGVISLDF